MVLIKTDKGTGTGFFINAYGTIATCYHVIQNANAINVRWKNRLTHAEVIYIEKKHDQALLNIFEKNTPYVQIQKHIAERVSDKQLVDPSDAVVVMGYPFASEKVKISNGKINDIYYKYEGNLPLSGVLENVTYKTDLVLHPGNSGSPVFDTYGIVIGMASAKVDTSKISSLSPKQEKDKKVSGMSFINSLDKLLSQNRLLFQANFEKKRRCFTKNLKPALSIQILTISDIQIVFQTHQAHFITNVLINPAEWLNITIYSVAVFLTYRCMIPASLRLFLVIFYPTPILKNFICSYRKLQATLN